MGNSKTPMFISAIAILINVSLNYVFIFGKLVLPALWVSGAAVATVIARFIECILLVITASNNKVLQGDLREYIQFKMSFVKTVYISVVPVVLNEACWGLGSFLYAIAYESLGTRSYGSSTNN